MNTKEEPIHEDHRWLASVIFMAQFREHCATTLNLRNYLIDVLEAEPPIDVTEIGAYLWKHFFWEYEITTEDMRPFYSGAFLEDFFEHFWKLITIQDIPIECVSLPL